MCAGRPGRSAWSPPTWSPGRARTPASSGTRTGGRSSWPCWPASPAPSRSPSRRPPRWSASSSASPPSRPPATWPSASRCGSAPRSPAPPSQLVLNITTMVVAGALLLAAQRAFWPWITAHSERYLGQRSAARPGRQVAVGVVGGEPQPLVERERRRVVAQHLQVRRGRAALGAPLQQRGHHASARPCRRYAGSTWMPRNPTQSSAYAATPARPVADPRPSPGRPSSRRPPVVARRRWRPAETPAAHPGHARPAGTRVRVAALRHPAVRAEHRVLGATPAAPRRSAGRSGARRTRRPARSRRRPPTARSPAPSWRAARSTWGSGAAPSRPAARSPGPATAPAPGSCAVARRDPLPRRGPRAAPACRRRCRRARSPRCSAVLGLQHADAVAPRPRRCRARRSTPGRPVGPVSPRRTRRTTTRWPTTCGTERCAWPHRGGVHRGTLGILGCRRAAPFPLRPRRNR